MWNRSSSVYSQIISVILFSRAENCHGQRGKQVIARRYFSEMVDKRSDKFLEELWTEDCVVHRPEVSATIKGREAFRHAFNRVVGPYSEFGAERVRVRAGPEAVR
jgi:SnoaL-like domain